MEKGNPVPMCERCHNSPAFWNVIMLTPEYTTDIDVCSRCAAEANRLGFYVCQLEKEKRRNIYP